MLHKVERLFLLVEGLMFRQVLILLMEKNSRCVQSTETSFALLEHIKEKGSMTVSNLAKESGRPKSTVHRHMTTLVNLGYVRKEENEYKLSLRFLDLGDRARKRYPLYSVGKSEIDELVEDTGERIQIMVSEGYSGVYIYQRTGNQGITTHSHIGKQVMLHSVASGKSFLANLPKDRVDNILDHTGMPSLTPNTITNRQQLFDELEVIEERGYAFNEEENGLGIRAVGAPICRDDNGTVVGALSFVAPKTRLRGDFYRKVIPERISDIAKVLGIQVTYK